MHRFDLSRIGYGLVVSEHLAELELAAKSGAMVVTAPPGTGKTTVVPPLVANLVAQRGSTLLTQPRRIAVRAAANRIAELDGSRVGGPAGFTVRGERRVSAETMLEVLTPGVLLRRLLSDPALEGVGAVILDEVHERSLEGDLILGLIAEVRELRDDLLVVAMSATLNASDVSAMLGGAPVVDIPSALYPLTTSFAPFKGDRLDHRGVTRGYLAHLAEVAISEQARHNCDALIFVPGAREVDETVRLLSDRTSLDVLALHGRISARDQDRAVKGRGVGEAPRFVVSTSLAESSLTVPGVHLVIDSGLAREVRRDRARDMTGLVTVSASRASAKQRAGRAARLGPGHACRVYSETDFAHMPAESQPEIMSADLTDAALLLAAWGTPEAKGLALLTAPPKAALDQAVTTLKHLELLDATGEITPLGAHVAKLPVGAREARALLDGTVLLGSAERAAEVIAAITDDYRDPGADAARLLQDLRSGRHAASARWNREVKRLTRIALDGTPAAATSMRAGVKSAADGISHPSNDSAHIIALARPEWLARKVSAHSRSYLFASGSRAALPEGSPLLEHEWIAVREVQRAEGRQSDGTGAIIRLAAPISADDALELGHTLATRVRKSRIIDRRVQVREQHQLGAITLTSTPVAATQADSGPAFTAHLAEVGLEALGWNETALSLRGRLALLHRELGAPWPAVDDSSLMATADVWLLPDLARLKPNTSLHAVDVVSALRRLLPWPEAARFEELAPSEITVPSGSRVRVEYPLDGAPTVSVKLQELFGLAETPRVADGRVPLLVHMLSPARSPIAVTDDLSSFWNGPYQDVRKEMRGRYSKHPWPEDPWSAQATAKTKRASGR